MARLHSSTEQPVGEKIGFNGPVEQFLTGKKRAAKIHNFCFGILFALAAALCWKNFQTGSSMHRLFASGLYAGISAAMLCFYSYVVISGGNPPPKNLKTAANVTSS